ncbi:MAG: hypothetical protein ACRCWM_13335 [Sarcina sp.]
MAIFKKKNLSDEITQAVSKTSPSSIINIGIGVGVLAGLGFYLFKKLNNTKTLKTNDNIIIHTTKLED